MVLTDGESSYKKGILTSRPIPALKQEQIEQFTWQTIHARIVREINPYTTLRHLEKLEKGTKVWSIDLGGTHLFAMPWYIENNQLLPDEQSILTFTSSKGLGYLASLEQIAKEASSKHIPVGISFAGPIKGTIPEDAPNMKVFLNELKEQYGGDFAKLFPRSLSFQNDATAGLIASAVFVSRKRSDIRYIDYLINGTGIGGAGLTDVIKGVKEDKQYIVATEIGHVKVDQEYNPYEQKGECGMFGSTYTCLELVGGGESIIRQWNNHTGKIVEGKKIAEYLFTKDPLAEGLYDAAAIVTALGTLGLGYALGMYQSKGDTVPVFHGGQFNVPDFRSRVDQIVEKNLGYEPHSISTSESIPYACAQGAALEAITNV
jgi:predicted NBD/HSP70 family sugar kinase